jgi:UDP-N-acetylglucosamine--N-acetylmuramyl-(pentapeptide) pyrophosphoryl-undecaprenol N-acetylglucosamine transferase
MKLLLSCIELGLGHVTRLIPLGKKLAERGHELHFFSGGTAYQLLQKEFRNVYPVTPVAWYETAHGVIASASLLNILIPLPYFDHDKKKLEIKRSSASETIHRYYELRQHIRKIKPDLIVADGDMHMLRLAHRWRIPSVYVTNIIRPGHSFSPLLIPGERFAERYVKQCTRIIVPDNPSPYTICEYNLGDLDAMRLRHKTDFVGTFVDMTPTKGGEEHIFAPISGPLGTRARLIQTIVPTLQKLKMKSIVSLGQPGKKATRKIGNCEIHTWLTSEQRSDQMANAKLIIFSGGHATCFETIKHMKPSIIMPTQPEQIGNGRKLQELGSSLLARNTTQLSTALELMLSNIELHKRNVEKLNEISRKQTGVNAATSIVERALEKPQVKMASSTAAD